MLHGASGRITVPLCTDESPEKAVQCATKKLHSPASQRAGRTCVPLPLSLPPLAFKLPSPSPSPLP